MLPRGWVVVVMILGVLLVLVSLLADTFGLGAQPGVIGWKQILGATVGLALVVAGYFLRRRES